jgi:hypothetical protein
MKNLVLLLFTAMFISSCSSSGDDEPMEQNTSTISLSTTSISFTDTKINETSDITFNINNTGNQIITFSSITAPDGYTPSPTSGTISSGANKTITLTFAPSEVKTYSGSIFITSNATNNIDLSVSGDGIANSAAKANYETNIKPIMTQNCSTTACHGSSKSGGIELSTYTQVKAEFQDNTRTGSLAQIENGDMPRNASKLPQATIDLIKKWISDGFLEN